MLSKLDMSVSKRQEENNVPAEYQKNSFFLGGGVGGGISGSERQVTGYVKEYGTE